MDKAAAAIMRENVSAIANEPWFGPRCNKLKESKDRK